MADDSHQAAASESLPGVKEMKESLVEEKQPLEASANSKEMGVEDQESYLSTAAPAHKDGQKDAEQSAERPNNALLVTGKGPMDLEEGEDNALENGKNAKADAQKIQQQELDRLLWLYVSLAPLTL